jgi:hypothetical protein
MNKKFLLTNWLILSAVLVFGQLPTFEWRLENGTLTSPTTYTVDVYLYNKGASSFELRGGTIAFLTNSAWRNGGTITTAKLASGLVAGQQSSAVTAYVTTAPEYWRQTITSLGAGSGTTIAAGTRILIFKMQLSNTVAYSTTASPNFAWKFNAAPSAGWGYTNGIGNIESVVSNTANTINQLNCHTPTFWNGSAWISKSVRTGADTAVIPSASKDAVIYTGTLPAGNLTCRNYELRTGATHNLGANTLNVGYNLINNGTLNASSGSINLAGTTATQTTKQTISGTSSVTTNNLSLVTGTSASLSTSINVNNNLTLTTGKISINNNNLTLGNSATISGASSTAYIVADSAGSLVINNVGPGAKGGDVLFPVGTADGYNPVTIKNSGVLDNFHVSVSNGVKDQGNSVVSGIVNKTWKITETNFGFSNLNVNLQWNAVDELPPFNRASSYISFVNSSGLWQAGSQSAATGSSPYTQTLSGVSLNNSFSSFAVASNNQLANATINASAGSNGSISPLGIITMNSGAAQRFTFTPDDGYKVDSVIVDGIKVDSIVGYTFNNVTSNRSIRVTFTPFFFTITAQTSANGTISQSGNININYGGSQRILFTPNTGYKVDSVIVDGIKVDSIVGYTFNNVTSNRSIRVTFTPIIYTITTQTNVNGTISPSGNINIAYGGSQRILFTPNSGYTIDSVIIDGIKVDSIVGYTFSNVTSNRSIRVTFKALPTPNIAISSLHPTGTYLNTNTSNNILASYQLIDSVSNALLSSLSFTTQGTYTTTDIQSMGFKCWLNSSNDLTGATQIGTGQAVVVSGGVITLSGLSQNIPIGTSYILVTCDISNTAENGNTIGLASTPIGNFTFSGNTTINGNSTLAAGNLFTINETGPVKMQYRTNNSYRENFSDIANWTNGFNSGIGAGRWAGVTISAGTIPNAKAITVSTANFQTSSSGAGIQRGSLTGNVAGTINFLSLGNNDNTSACAVDFFMDFTKRNADSLIFDAVTVFNSVGNRNSTLRVFWSIDGTNFTELTGSNLPYIATNNIANSSTIRVKLPSAFNNVSTCRLRFYYHNGTGGTTSLRPKISIDNVQVTSLCPVGTSTTNIISCTPYTWNGETYSTSGVYNKIFYGASDWGCDSVASLNLNINTIASFNPFQDTLKICGASYSLNSGSGYTSYLWNTGATTSTISPTRAGWYKVTVSNGTCSASDSVYLSLNNAKINKNDTTVCPNVVFSLIATDSAAILPLSYLWSNGTTTSQTQFIANIPSTYYCTISNGINSCTDSSKVKINTISTYNPFPDTLNACGTPFPLNAGKGYVSYLWNTGSIWDTTNTYNTNWYKVTVNNGACSATDSVYLRLDRAKISASKKIICNGETVNLSAPQTNAYTWSTGASNTNILVKPTSTTKYYLTVNNVISDCIDSVTIVVNSLPVPNLQDTLKVCGDSVLINPGNFARYVWSNGDSVATTAAKASGMYKVIVSNAEGCTAIDSVLISLVKAKIKASKTRICKGETVTLQADTAVGALLTCAKTYLPSNLQTGLVAYYPFCGNANDASVNGNNGTVYGAALTTDRFGKSESAYDFNGITNYIKMLNPGPLGSNSRSISVWAKLDSFNGSSCMFSYGLYTGAGNVFEFSIGDNGTCKGLVIDASGANALMSFPTGFNPYSWHLYTAVFNNSVSNNISQIQYYTDGNLQTTYCYNGSIGVNTLNNEPIYIGKLTAYNGRFFNGKIDEVGLWNRALTAIEVQQLYTTSAPKAQTYAWNTASASNSISVTPTTTTKYYLTVNNGISSCIDSVTIIVDSLPVPNLQDTLKVCGESILLNPGSFARYAWSNGDTSSTLTPKTSGSYKVVVTNSIGCSTQDSVFVSLINADITNSDTTICFGKSITLNATGSGVILSPLSYLWSNSSNNQSITVSPALTTMYYCTVSNGINSCTDSVKVTKDNFNPNLFVQDTLKVCGTSYSLNAGNGYSSYLWNIGSTAQSIIATTAGWKNCLVSNGFCSSKDSVLLSLVNADITNRDTTICFGKNITLNATGSGVISSPLSYLWSNSSNNQNITVSPALTIMYYCTVSNGINSCTDSLKVTKDNFNPNLFVQDTLKVCGTSYSLNAGNGYVSYVWNTSSTAQSIIATTAGWKNCVVSNGFCSSKDSVLLSIVNADITNRDTTICLGKSVTLNATGSGVISSSLSYLWNNSSNNQSITVSPALTTMYYCTVSNGINSCTDSVKVTKDNFNPNLFVQDTLKVCGTSYTLNTDSGYVSYVWNNGSTTRSLNTTSSGWKNCTVSNGFCSSKDSVLLSMINANIINNDSTILAGTTITLRATGTGIISNPLSYVWSNGANTQNITVSPTQKTTYYCRVSNGVSSCADTVKIGVNVNINLKMYFEAFYENGSLKSSLNNADGMSDIILFDTIQIMLYDSISNSVVFSIKSIADTGGNCQILIPSAYANNRYYIGIKHRGSIETWSSSSVLLNNGIFYNFTNSASKAYGANLKDNGNGVYLIYNGDVNQDGAVDFADYPDLDIGSNNGDLGYLPTDLNGDGSVDFGDYPILDINSNDGIIAFTPIVYNALRSNKAIKKSVLIK